MNAVSYSTSSKSLYTVAKLLPCQPQQRPMSLLHLGICRNQSQRAHTSCLDRLSKRGLFTLRSDDVSFYKYLHYFSRVVQLDISAHLFWTATATPIPDQLQGAFLMQISSKHPWKPESRSSQALRQVPECKDAARLLDQAITQPIYTVSFTAPDGASLVELNVEQLLTIQSNVDSIYLMQGDTRSRNQSRTCDR